MEKSTFRGYVSTWYKNDIAFSIELIEKFVKNTERQVQNSIDDYELQKKTVILEEIPEIELRNTMEVHNGLNSQDWDLYRVFNEYFPNLQRKSALLTLYSYFENELNKLCLLYESEKKLENIFTKFEKDKGIDRSTNYLKSEAKLNVYKDLIIWNEIKKIQNIRNLIVHQDGKIRDKDKNKNTIKDQKPIVDYIKQKSELLQLKCITEMNEEIEIKNGFLAYVADIYKQYFKLLHKSIEANELV